MLNSVVDSSQFVARSAICGFVESGHAPDFGLQCVGKIYFEGKGKVPTTPPPSTLPKPEVVEVARPEGVLRRSGGSEKHREPPPKPPSKKNS